jgi:hypothetical protein
LEYFIKPYPKEFCYFLLTLMKSDQAGFLPPQ